jgi:4-hydroxy-2-oxoglutarate aldolase
MLLEGLHIPLTTPFHPDGRLNSHKLASNVARHSKTPAAGLIVLGPNAEPTLLTDDETREALHTAAAAAAPEKVLIAGISRDSIHASLALADFTAALHYDAILIGVPSVLASQSTLRRHELLTCFLTIADRSPLPIVLFSSNTRRIPTDVVAELAAHSNIIALLDASSPGAIEEHLKSTAAIKREVTVTPTFTAVTARMLRAFASASSRTTLISANSLTASATAVAEPPPAFAPLRTRTKTVGFQLLAGDTAGMLTALRAGATGITPAFAACAPQACYEVFAAWKEDDRLLAEEKNCRLQEAAHLAESTPGLLKFGCDLNGYFGGLPRLPHLPPTGDQRTALEHLMQGMRN